jgi:7-keto-8-aminopelargonate synthetase-like enzyme
MLDEAHSLGVLGATGSGICEEAGVPVGDVDILMGTLSKTLCSAGGFVAGSRVLIDLLRYQAPGFVYSVGLSIPNTAAALAALSALRADPGRVTRLRSLGAGFLQKARSLGLDTGQAIGDSLRAVWISARLLEQGFNVLPIIAPAVPERSARLRFFLNAGHETAQIDAVLDCTAALVAQARGLTFS